MFLNFFLKGTVKKQKQTLQTQIKTKSSITNKISSKNAKSIKYYFRYSQQTKRNFD